MLNIEGFITKVRDTIINSTSLKNVYSPDLPQEGEKICCVTLLPGKTNNNLCNVNEYNTLMFRVLIRGTKDDIDTRPLVDEVFNALHLLKNLSFTGGIIINIFAPDTPIFVERGSNQRILYNITFKTNVQ